MPEIPAVLRDVLARFTVSAIIDILIVSGSIYWLLLLVRGTAAMTVLRGVGLVLLAALVLSQVFDLQMINWIVRNSVTGLLIGMVIIFQPELRRALERRGRTGLRSVLHRREHEGSISIVVRAAMMMARESTGALIVLERETGLQDVIETGIRLDAGLSVELLQSLFNEHAPMHDGAVIVRVDRVVAAGCTLPLSEAPLPVEYGMRHRSAVGLTERTDAVVIVCSEERGDVSLCSNGRMVPDLDETRLTRQLHRLFDIDFIEREAATAGDRLAP